MSVKDRLNGRGERKFHVQLEEDITYVKLSDIYTETTNVPLQILGAYVKDGKYGETSSLICGAGRGLNKTSNLVVNLPKHLVKDVKEMIEDSECVADINNGYASFNTKTYLHEGQTRYTVKWMIGKEAQRDDIEEWANSKNSIINRIARDEADAKMK